MKKQLMVLQLIIGLIAVFALLSMLIQYEFEQNSYDLALQDIVRSGFIFIGSILLLIYVKLFSIKK